MLNILLGATAYMIGKPVMSAYDSMINSVLGPIMLPGQYDNAVDWRTMLPGISDMFNAYLQGEVTRKEMEGGLRAHNINFDPDFDPPYGTKMAKWWKAVTAAQLMRMPYDHLMYCYYSGVITEEEYQKLNKFYALRQGFGEPMRKMMYGKFDTQTILTNYYRGIWKKPEVIDRLRRLGGIREHHANDLIQASEFIPPPSDLITFAVKDVFNPDVIARDNLDQEFSENKDLREWFYAQGIKEGKITTPEGKEITHDWPMAYWVAHWQLPSPGQGYEFLHRLRPNRLSRWGNTIPGLEAFSFKNLNDLLKQADYSPRFRKELAAISYNMPRLIDIRQMYFKHQFDDDELREKLLDRGYGPDDAKEIVDYYHSTREDKDDEEEEKKHGKFYNLLRAQIKEAYKVGVYDRTQAFRGLSDTGWKDEDVNTTLASIDLGILNDTAKAYIKQVEAAFYTGDFDGIEAVERLLGGGIKNTRAYALVQRWQRRQTLPRKMANSAKLIEWYLNGLIDLQEVNRRLWVLGWTNADILIYMNEAYEKMEEKKAKVAAQQAKTEEQRIAATKRLMKEAEAARRRQIDDFAKHSTPALMREWYAKDLISKEDIFNRLIYMMWTNDDATRFVESLG